MLVHVQYASTGNPEHLAVVIKALQDGTLPSARRTRREDSMSEGSTAQLAACVTRSIVRYIRGWLGDYHTNFREDRSNAMEVNLTNPWTSAH